mmetsp:Transcript_45495/g.126259  ORF Transcript_45495/g.126259 Transcript_45495/m.126259 type:complete len:263 (+) Transcript_45495:113-901(+)
MPTPGGGKTKRGTAGRGRCCRSPWPARKAMPVAAVAPKLPKPKQRLGEPRDGEMSDSQLESGQSSWKLSLRSNGRPSAQGGGSSASSGARSQKMPRRQRASNCAPTQPKLSCSTGERYRNIVSCAAASRCCCSRLFWPNKPTWSSGGPQASVSSMRASDRSANSPPSALASSAAAGDAWLEPVASCEEAISSLAGTSGTNSGATSRNGSVKVAWGTADPDVTSGCDTWGATGHSVNSGCEASSFDSVLASSWCCHRAFASGF